MQDSFAPGHSEYPALPITIRAAHTERFRLLGFLLRTHLFLNRLAHFLLANLLQLFVLLRVQNGLHLRIAFLMDGLDLLRLLHRAQR